MKLICPDCGTQYESGKFCLECGAKLQEVAPELVCPSCGYKAKTGKFCPECGAKLTEQIVAQEEMPKNETAERKFNERDPRFAKYYDRKGFPRPIPQEERTVAIEELTPFANQNIAEAKMLLGGILLNDSDRDNVMKGASMLKEAEQEGDKFAYYYMSLGFFYGWEPIVKQDHNEAEKRMLELYQEYDNGDAAQLLAELYAFSEEKCDYKKAFEYATIAAEDDQERGYFVLGALYLNGWGVEKNVNLALDNYKIAAAHGDETAMNQIGFIFMGDEGIEENPEQSFYWFNEAAKKGSDVGMFNLGYCYKNGFGIEADAEQAAEWFKKAAELGYVDAMCELGGYYQEILVDIKKAKMWYLKAAELGNAEAQNKLGVVYADIENDYDEAIKWYKKAMDQDNSFAYRNYAFCLWTGKGVKVNKEKAMEMMQKAISLGHPDAENELNGMQQELEDERKAAKMESERAVSPKKLRIQDNTTTYDAPISYQEEDSSNKWLYAIIAVLLAAIIGVGYLWYSHSQTNDNKSAISDISAYQYDSESENEKETLNKNIAAKQVFNANGVSFAMIGVQGGTFRMGCSKSEDSNADSDESPTHLVTLSPYYLGETEVTQELWEAVMDYNPSEFQYDNQLPVEFVSWDECEEFIQRLNRITQKKFRFPTEAEWEYAARGGHKAISSTYAGSNNISAVGWFKANSNEMTHPVKSKSPNSLGLYDMSGNLWEWCQDWQGPYSSNAVNNPTGPNSGSNKILRGGAWNGGPKNCRLSNRDGRTTDYASNRLGLRLALYD